MNSKPETIRAELGRRSYDVVIGTNLLEEAGCRIKQVILSDKVIIITDENVARIHLPALKKSLKKENIETEEIILPVGEQTKSFSWLEKLLEDLLDKKPDRNITLIALGGGVIGDITGFAASILLRGVNFIQVPTTLLAMVDSSVGGKTGINTRHGKNLIGSFYQPLLVLADIKLLETLPKREWLAGYAEIVKYGLIRDAAFFSTLEKVGAIVASMVGEKKDKDEERAFEGFCEIMISESCRAKSRIVSSDETEKGKRALLNFGHTFAHALEAETGYSDSLLHGEAVSIGMVMAFQLSYKLGLCEEDDLRRVGEHLMEVGLPTSPLDIKKKMKAESLLGHMYQDKKVKNGKIAFVLANGIGKAFIKNDVAEKDAIEFLKMILRGSV